MKNILQHTVALVLIIVMALCVLLNKNGTIQIISALINSPETQSTEEVLQSLSDIYKSNFTNQLAFTDLFGGVQRLLGKRIVGNYEFVKDNAGVMQYYAYGLNTDFSDQVIQLKETCDTLNTPFLYVQCPARVTSSTQFSDGYSPNNDKNQIDLWTSALESAGVDVLDYQAELIDTGEISQKDVFFISDAHMTTESALLGLEAIVQRLENSGVTFENKDIVLDWNNQYMIDSREFLGSYSKSTGKFFCAHDSFNMYLPKFSTSLAFWDANGTVIRQGTFEQALLNGYELDPASDLNTYWVTNYGNYPQATYSYQNNAFPDGSSILLIMDSMGLSLSTYLSLMCSNVTIVDPRYTNSGALLSSILDSRSFDAVIVLQSTTLAGHELLFQKDSLQAEIVSQDLPDQLTAGKTATFSVTVKNTGKNSWSEESQVRLGIFLNGADCGARAYIPSGVTIAPGETYTFTFTDLTLPAAGTKMEFYMLQEGVTYFGDRVQANAIIN